VPEDSRPTNARGRPPHEGGRPSARPPVDTDALATFGDVEWTTADIRPRIDLDGKDGVWAVLDG